MIFLQKSKKKIIFAKYKKNNKVLIVNKTTNL